MLGRFDEFCSGYRSQKPENDPTGSYPALLSHSPGISMAATIFHGDEGRVIRLSQCQLLVLAGANRSQVRICYGIEKVLTEPGLAAHCSPACESTGDGESYFLVSFSVLSPFYSTQ